MHGSTILKFVDIYILCAYFVILSNMIEKAVNKVQMSSPELGDTGYPAPVQRVPFAVSAAAPNACRYRDPAAVFSGSELTCKIALSSA